MPRDQTPGRLRVVLLAVALAAGTFVVFAPCVGHDFVDLDDPVYVTANPWVLEGITAEGVVRAFTTTETAFYQPLTLLSHMLDCAFFSRHAWGHHLSNVVLHTINTVLLFLALCALTRAAWRSALVAALFALHPLAVESVAWVSQRKDTLSTLFLFAMLLAYAGYARRPSPWRYVPVLCLLLLGLLAKTMLVTAPFLLLLLDYWPLRRGHWPPWQAGHRRQWGKLVLEKMPALLLVGLFCVLSYTAQHQAGALASGNALPFSARLANAVISYMRYLQKAVCPIHLAVYYPHPGTSFSWPLACGAAALLAAISACAVWTARRFPYVLVGWLWYVGTLVPVIGFVQIAGHAMADRYAYITLTGIYIAIAWGLGDLVEKRRIGRGAIGAGIAVVLVLLAVGTSLQRRHWRNTETLFRHTLRVTDDNAFAHMMLGTNLFDTGRPEEAEAELSEALRILPEFIEARANLGMVYLAQGDFKAAAEQLREVLRLDPDYQQAQEALQWMHQEGHLKPEE